MTSIACLTCGKLHNNPKFCSRSCSAKHSNISPKRKRTKQCKNCEVLILSNRTFCSHECAKACGGRWTHCNGYTMDGVKVSSWQNKTLADYQGRAKYQVNSQVRSVARQVMDKSGVPKKCCKCGYDKHVEVSHIKPISHFSSDSLIMDINSIDNLEYLCPNCHWEHDNFIKATVFSC